jgi:hypothetical protein
MLLHGDDFSMAPIARIIAHKSTGGAIDVKALASDCREMAPTTYTTLGRQESWVARGRIVFVWFLLLVSRWR